MNGHDPLCGWGSDNHPDCFPAEECGNCEMIKRVRLDILNDQFHNDETLWKEAYNVGYEYAMKDCNMTYEDFKKRNEEWSEIMKAMGIERES